MTDTLPRRLRHVFKPDEATMDRYGVRCSLCGDREHSLGHIPWPSNIWYRNRMAITWNARDGRWVDRAEAP